MVINHLITKQMLLEGDPSCTIYPNFFLMNEFSPRITPQASIVVMFIMMHEQISWRNNDFRPVLLTRAVLCERTGLSQRAMRITLEELTSKGIVNMTRKRMYRTWEYYYEVDLTVLMEK